MNPQTSQTPLAQPMTGGAKMIKQAFLDWGKQSNQLLMTIFTLALLTFAVYADKLPMTVKYQLSTTVGRLLLLILLYIVYVIGGWIPALTAAIGIAVLWSNRPLAKPTSFTHPVSVEEGFSSSIKVTPARKQQWFVEEVLEEHPEGIMEDRVDNMTVQDDSEVGNSRTSK